jgi:hypothetical protein
MADGTAGAKSEIAFLIMRAFAGNHGESPSRYFVIKLPF